ncbi:MAG: hypothetical protein IAG13_32970 [Deltaproteobacteria bacterium]|nr:hypothetical protein [Nannocystaceae bacterium]
MSARGWLIAAGVLLGTIAGACVDEANPEHCANAAGDASCADRYPDGSRPYCELGSCAPEARDGCVAERPTSMCAAPCGDATGGDDCIAGTGESSSTADASTLDTSSSTDASTLDSSAGTESSSTGPACVDDSDCAGRAPFCRGGACVDCSGTNDGDAACLGLDPDAPLCDAGVCVQCTAEAIGICSGTVPVCDAATHTCVGCSDHAQCPDSACHLDEGSCMPDDRVWYVDGDAGSCVAADGSMAAPWCTIADALAQIGPSSRGTLRIVPTAQPYAEAIVIEDDRVVALISAEPGLPELDASGASTLTVDGATVFVQRLRLLGNTGAPAVALTDASAWLDRSELVLNQGGGVTAVDSSRLHLRGVVVGAGGTGLADRQALLVDGSSFEVVASTIAGNDGSGFASLRCIGAVDGSIRASIVIGLDAPSISCTGATVEASAIDSDLPGDNLVLDDFDAAWFVDPAAGDFHLAPGTPFEDIGVWHDGDLVVDLDGDARGGVDGAIDFAGADVIP